MTLEIFLILASGFRVFKAHFLVKIFLIKKRVRRLQKYMWKIEKESVIHSFIYFNFNCCPLVSYFFVHVNPQIKLSKYKNIILELHLTIMKVIMKLYLKNIVRQSRTLK